VSVLDQLVLRIKRGDTAAARTARDVYRWAQRWSLPQSTVTRRLFGALYRGHDLYEAAREYLGGKLVYEPMVRARFHKVGSGVQLSALPYVVGHAQVTIGDDCQFGYFSIRSGRFVDRPELVFGNSVMVSSGVIFVVNRRISVGDHTGIAGKCWISDSDGHPVELERRLRGEELTPEDIRPLTIEDHVWIGHGSHILKGVTIGRGAVVAAGSVVTGDVPAGALAMGVPARILRQPW
jgi:acetyltransferase-like isoleucine patch superfamily enzyme